VKTAGHISREWACAIVDSCWTSNPRQFSAITSSDRSSHSLFAFQSLSVGDVFMLLHPVAGWSLVVWIFEDWWKP
jgi:hypothetical protein